jgi:hypothetical protein
MENRAFKIAGIKNLMKTNYNVPTDLIDLEAEIDDTLSMSENWNNLKEKILMLCEKETKILWD